MPSPVYSLAFSPNNRELAIGGFDNTIRYVSPRSGRRLAQVKLEGGAVTTLRWLTQTKLAAAGASEKSVSVWHIEKRKVVLSTTKRAEWVSQIALGPSGKAYLGSIHRTVLCADTESGKTVFVRRLHDDAVSALAISTDGRLLATGANDQRVILWDAENGREAAALTLRAPVSQLSFSPDSSQLAVSLVDHGIRVFELQTGNLRNTLWGHEKPVEGLAYHPDGRLLASVSRDGTIRLWNTATGETVERLGGHSGPVKAVAFSNDGKYLAAGSLDRVVTLWAVDKG
ncbi:MAG: WD40 repeat domain-containing protein [Armatimonadetes bacterium]|nr:WD40 repeat domain-containing protein [Armatimonadota bacterium]